MSLCECGCGELTPIATRTVSERGHVKGRPKRFSPGHHARLSTKPHVVEDRGYDTPCWVWQGYAHGNNGYGNIERDGRTYPAHRYVYERERGPISDGLELDHLCRVPLCVNPEHLELVTHAENMRRGKAVKLTAQDVVEIRAATGVTLGALAKRYGVSPSMVGHIRAGRKWAA